MFSLSLLGLIIPSNLDFVNVMSFLLKTTIDKKESYSTLQLISFIPLLFKNSFVFENGLLPKKPLYAENGDG